MSGDDMRGVDGAIGNFMPDISAAAAQSNGFVLELGVATGTGSTVAIQEGLAEHHNPLHISVDKLDYMTAKPATPWWHFICGDSKAVTTRSAVCTIADIREPGLIFIDTNHDGDQIRQELRVWGPWATEQTVWLFHDTWMFGVHNDSMVGAIKEYADRNGWIYEDFRPEPHGLGRMRR